MTTSPPISPAADVLVVGAGPTGLLLAAELAQAGVRVVVLERREEPDRTIKAGSINVATAEILDRRGLLPALQEVQRRTTEQVASVLGGSGSHVGLLRSAFSADHPSFPVTAHLAGLMLRPDLIDQDDPALLAHRGVADAVLVPQAELERILLEHALGLGVEVRRGVEVAAVEQGPDLVTVRTATETLTAPWLVGADGGRSLVRHALGVGFEGTDPEIVGRQALADLDGAEGLALGWTWTPRGVYSHGPVPGRVLTVEFTTAEQTRSAPVTPEEVEASLRRVSGVDVRVRALRGAATRWSDNARQATSYRCGRVLLAGDAAHVHSPFSGQGLNLGIGDASNLGWKLAATVLGEASDSLLDTYDAERRPVAAWVLDWTRAQVALMRGDAKTEQLRRLVGQELIGTTAGTTRVVRLASGIAQRYAVAPGLTGGVDTEPGDLGRLVGHRTLADGRRLAEAFLGGRAVLLDATGGDLTSLTDRSGDRVVRERADAGASASLLARPDGVIVWVARSDERPDLPALEAALRRWTGSAGLALAPAAVAQ